MWRSDKESGCIFHLKWAKQISGSHRSEEKPVGLNPSWIGQPDASASATLVADIWLLFAHDVRSVLVLTAANSFRHGDRMTLLEATCRTWSNAPVGTSTSGTEIGHLSQQLKLMTYGTEVAATSRTGFIRKKVFFPRLVAEWHHPTNIRIKCRR